MQQTILLNATENTRQVEREEQGHFVRSILSAFGVPIDDIWDSEELSTDQHIKLRKVLSTYKIEIIDDNDGGVKIHCWDKETNKYQMIGEFKKPYYRLKQDPSQVNPNKKQYLEMSISTWSIFDTDEKDE